MAFYNENEVFFDFLLDFQDRLLEHIDSLDTTVESVMPPTYGFTIHEGVLSIYVWGLPNGGIVTRGSENDILTCEEWQLIEYTLKLRIVPRSSYREGLAASVTSERISVMLTNSSMVMGSPVMTADNWGNPDRITYTEGFNDDWSFYFDVGRR